MSSAMSVNTAHPAPVWLLLAGLVLFGGSLGYSLRTGKTYFQPAGGTITRDAQPLAYWGMCAFKLLFVVTSIAMLVGKLRHA